MRVLLALDGTANGEPAAAAIADWARDSAAEVVILSVLDPREVHATRGGSKFVGVLSRDGGPTGPLLRGVVPVEVTVAAEDRSQALVRARGEREGYLRRLAGEWFSGVDVTVDAPDGEDIADVVVTAAIAHKADIIAMATRGRSAFGQAMFGAVHEDVVRRATVPVLLVGPKVETAAAAALAAGATSGK